MHPEFQAGAVDTAFVKAQAKNLQAEPLLESELALLLSAAVLVDRDLTQLMQFTPEPYLAIGRWRN